MECVHGYLEDTKVPLREHPPSNPVDIDAASSILTDPPTDEDEIALAWHQHPEAVGRQSPEHHFFHGYGLRDHHSPLKNSSRESFQCLGFAIWDLKRMCTLELICVPSILDGEPFNPDLGRRISWSECCFIWRSIKGS